MKKDNNSALPVEESYFRYKLKDFFALLCIVVIWAAVHALGSKIPGLVGYTILFIVMVFFATFTIFFINKFGSVFIVSLLAITLIPSLPDLAGLGLKRYIIMGAVGICFELLHWILSKIIKVDPLKIIISSSISFATMPFWTGLMLSLYLMKLRRIDLLNLMFLDGILAFLGAALAFLVWFYIRTYPFILKYEYGE